MSLTPTRTRVDKVNAELVTLTYGTIVAQLCSDYENDYGQVNQQLDKMGYNIGMRLIEDFLAKSNTARCGSFRETADMISKVGFKIFLNITPTVTNWTADNKSFSLVFDENPLADFVELPDDGKAQDELWFSNILCGVLRGALEAVQMAVEARFVSDILRGNDTTEIRVTLLRYIEDEMPPDDDETGGFGLAWPSFSLRFLSNTRKSQVWCMYSITVATSCISRGGLNDRDAAGSRRLSSPLLVRNRPLRHIASGSVGVTSLHSVSMNMAGVNPGAAGGPVGGNMVMMNNGSPAMAQHMESSPEAVKELFNTYIYEYLVRLGLSDVARTLLQKQDVFKIRTEKGSPNNRKSGEANGVDTDGMDMDMKHDFPDDLPRPQTGPITGPNGFLFEWFSAFQDMYQMSQSRVKTAGAVSMGTVTAQYLAHTQGPHRSREIHQAGGLARGAGMNNQLANMRTRFANGVPNGMSADARKSMTPQQLQQFNNPNRMMAQSNNPQQMPREQAEVDMNGRPGTPAEGDNGGSPSKRPRLENQQFNGGMMPNGRPMQGGPPQGMMIQNSFNPQMSQNQFRPNGAMGQKPMPPNMANAMNLMNSSGSPMMAGMSHGQFGDNMAMEMYNNSRMGTQPMPNAPGANNGNHALQDYQMQLMLLEQQNKKRLMMARQEQDNAVSREGGPLPMSVAPGMSPSGSRSGTSPNPAEQLKRAAHLGGLPASPAGGENMQGRSPAAIFMNGMPPGGEFNQAMFMGGEKPGMVGPAVPGMRPPTSLNMGQPSRMAQPMMQNPSQGGQQPLGTPGQRNDMPPPQAPPGGSATRNQPPSPAPSSNAPPTPSQSNKAPPKGKKAKEAAAAGSDSKKKTAKKGNQSNAGAENEPPATPTPSTPITPQHPNSFNGPAKGQPGLPNNAQAQVPQMPPQQPMPQAPDMGANFEFGDGQNFNLDFSTLDSTDVLENFDFDSFLNTSTDEPFSFPDGMGGGDFTLETGE
ncbi:hypothetical protein DV737_g2541, partial [Chaetothyriales sp. CBS 132003]